MRVACFLYVLIVQCGCERFGKKTKGGSALPTSSSAGSHLAAFASDHPWPRRPCSLSCAVVEHARVRTLDLASGERTGQGRKNRTEQNGTAASFLCGGPTGQRTSCREGNGCGSSAVHTPLEQNRTGRVPASKRRLGSPHGRRRLPRSKTFAKTPLQHQARITTQRVRTTFQESGISISQRTFSYQRVHEEYAPGSRCMVV